MGSLPLPEDALADVLRRLSPRSLAASRCVCKAWRDIIDGRSLLLPDLLPHSVHGIFLMYHDLDFPAFLSHPSMEPEIFDKLHFYHLHPDSYSRSFTNILDHCNGLLLYQDFWGAYVVNPATQRRAQLPPEPRFGGSFLSNVGHLLFDPTESPHYEVLLVPADRWTEEVDREMRQQLMDKSEEWPASIWVLCMFSSRTWQWEERAFVREGDDTMMAFEEIGDPLWRASSAYWRGAFFVQCNDGSAILRISLSNDKYRVIKLPQDIGDTENNKPCLGRSKEGVCCATFDRWISGKLRVWILDESCGKMEWVLKYRTDIEHNISRVMSCRREMEGPWTLHDANSAIYYGEDVNNYGNDTKTSEHYGEDLNIDEDDNNNSEDCADHVSNDEDDNNALLKSKFEWDSDRDNIIDDEFEVEQNISTHNTFLGFHPFKDVVFLNVSLDRAVAYHLDTCTIQDLGEVRPRYYNGPVASVISSFVYTPCLIAEFPESK
ncbi:hypothetical protein QOZ80_3AG0218380 [Eleusine coracana subsp. coracana]|nr:hypothetical protein QOZ80_3AG0218380 [Eleusine coracana subsp. coracana]